MTIIAEQDLHCIWHPCSQMKDFETFKPLVIQRAYGSYLELADGFKIIDGISSWWCKSLGHNHPRIKKALLSQIEKFEHVIFANTTNDTIIELSQQLTQLIRGLNKVFYAGDGSCAVEIALKMSLHCRLLKQQSQKTRFVALKHGYHGDTCAAMSVSDVGLYRTPYRSMLFDPILIEPPYVNSTDDLIWQDASASWQDIESWLIQHTQTVTAIIVEPLLQGAGGMKMYSCDFLTKLAKFAREHDIHLIADEIMTGMGRTGKMLACEHSQIQPDFICLSKGLTSGWMPFSAVLTTSAIYDIFYANYESGKSFLHSHTYSGHVLGASVALATLKIMKEENICHKAEQMQWHMRCAMEQIAKKTGLLNNIRGIGAVVAADMAKTHGHTRIGFQFSQEAAKLGALLRPIGHTLYWMPPLTLTDEELNQLQEITEQALVNVYAR